MANRSRRQVARRRIQSQINITPLIDVLLVLIVIFMVITPINSTGLAAAMPSQASALLPPDPPQDSLVLSVEKDGTIKLNHNKVNSMADLTSSLQDVFKTRSDRTIFVQGSKNLDFDVIAHVIDTAVGSGASRIGLLTEEIY